ncbi:BURP domain-containing protein 3-like [Triticum aestivum]|nr:BURP domain-containing protein 3-like [Triticum aestivum]
MQVACVEHAAGTAAPEQYWKSLLPNTPMPSSLFQLLNASSVSASVGAEHQKPRGTTVGVRTRFRYHTYLMGTTEVHADPSVALFFLKKDLQMRTGQKKLMKVDFMATRGAGDKFLLRSEADAIPFTTEKLPQILSRFSVKPGSLESSEMAQTLQDCEARAAQGEQMWCATSLESMIDFAMSSLGSNELRAMSTAVGKEGTPMQEYTLTSVTHPAADQLVVCHMEPYAYAVFACHLTRATRAYIVSMAGEDGTDVEAVALCHADTAGWNPTHVAFQVLKVKPGTVPVCHLESRWQPAKSYKTESYAMVE